MRAQGEAASATNARESSASITPSLCTNRANKIHFWSEARGDAAGTGVVLAVLGRGTSPGATEFCPHPGNEDLPQQPRLGQDDLNGWCRTSAYLRLHGVDVLVEYDNARGGGLEGGA